MIIQGLCADYERRAKVIAENCLPPRIISEAKYYNVKIFDAVAEIVGEEKAKSYIQDIGSRTGYNHRPDAEYLSEVTYYRKKRECKINIAKKLNFVEQFW